MPATKSRLNPDVSVLLDQLNHPLRREIETLRKIILSANPVLKEDVKWNSPNYSYGAEDRITMKVMPPKNIQLIFHRGAKKLLQPKTHLINEDFGLLAWKENDRAVATFANMDSIQKAQTEIKAITVAWVKAAK